MHTLDVLGILWICIRWMCIICAVHTLDGFALTSTNAYAKYLARIVGFKFLHVYVVVLFELVLMSFEFQVGSVFGVPDVHVV